MLQALKNSFILFCLLSFSIEASESAYFERLTNQQGMNSSYVNQVIQRKDGFVWLATAGGLSRFDGYNFANFDSIAEDPTSLPNSWVNCLFEDSKGKLWVGTEKGLATLKPNEREFQQYLFNKEQASSIAGNHIRDIFEDSKKRIWVASNKGLSMLLPDNKSFVNYFLPDNSNTRGGINFILQDEPEHLWLGTDSGLFIFNIANAEFENQPLFSNNKNMPILKGAMDRENNLWLALGDNGVAKYSTQNKLVKHYLNMTNDNNSISSNHIWSIDIDARGIVWAGTWGSGLNAINPITNQIKRFKHNKYNQNSIPSNSITDIMQDDSGNIWVATYDGFALYQPDRAVELRSSNQEQGYALSVDYVWAIAEDKNSIWLGTTEGLNQWDKESNKISHYYAATDDDDTKEAISIWVIENGAKDQLWLGTEFGLATFNKQTKKISYLHHLIPQEMLSNKEKEILKQPVWAIHVNQDNSVWVGSNAQSFYLFDQSQGIIKDYSRLVSESIGKDSIIEFTSINKDSTNNLWLSSTSGLFFLNTKSDKISKIKSLDGSKALADDWIYTTARHINHQEGDKNLYWVSSDNNGLSLLDFKPDGSIERLKHINNSYDNFDNKSIYSAIQVDSQNIWFTYSGNMYHYNSTSDSIINYGNRFFKPGTIFHENSQHKDASGFLYFGSSHGVVKFNPDDIIPQDYPTKMYFTSISSNTLDLKAGNTKSITSLNKTSTNEEAHIEYLPPYHQQRIKFPYDNVMFSFEFTVLDYSQSKNIRYSYRLNGFQDAWQRIGNKHEITLSNLSAGDYQLEVDATNGTSKINKTPLILNFTVEQKPWLTWWAYSCYLLLASVFLSYFYRFWSQKLLAQHALDYTELKLSQALWGSGDELWEWHIESNLLLRTNKLNCLSERSPEFNGKFNLHEIIIHPDDVIILENKFNDIISGKAIDFEAIYRQKDKNDHWTWLLDKAKVIEWDSSGKPKIVSGTCRNINKLKENEDKNRLIASAFQSTSDGAIVLDRSLRVLSINEAFCDITELKTDLIGNRVKPKDIVFETLPDTDTSKETERLTFRKIKDEVLKNKNYKNEVLFNTTSGKKIPLVIRVSCILDINEKVSHFVVMITDIKYRQEAEKKLRKLASFDSLTGLPNRSYLMQLLEQGILRAKRHHSRMAILFIDLDHFKNVNDSLGHNIGDELLIRISQKLKACVRETDSVARLGGDEFTIALFEINGINDILTVAEKILEDLSKPIQLDRHELIISPSIGIASYPEDGTNVDVLLQHADTAMYHAKHNGRNNFQFFDSSMNQVVLNRVELEVKLRKAVKEEEFELYYQPKYSLNTGEICGFEALIRWNDPKEGVVPPNDFIPTAEETGLIIPIGEWVLEQACRQLKAWSDVGYSKHHLAINISALQFMDKLLVNKVADSIAKYGIEAHRLELELTESTLIENIEYTKLTLMSLRQVGVRLSLDDFGTGFSSLNYLRQFPIHALKIDRSFVDNMVHDKRDERMVESIIMLAHNIGVSVVAEGVESKEQLKMLAQYKAEQTQGFLLSKPVKLKQANQLLNSHSSINSLLKLQTSNTIV